MKVTRRELAGLALATAALAQDDPDEQLKRNAEALDRFELKQDTEPAFVFKA
jgi:hypothetical protein